MISFLNLSLTDSLNPVFSWLASANGKAQLASSFRMLTMSLGSKIFRYSKKRDCLALSEVLASIYDQLSRDLD